MRHIGMHYSEKGKRRKPLLNSSKYVKNRVGLSTRKEK
jgi:hypothetical protein